MRKALGIAIVACALGSVLLMVILLWSQVGFSMVLLSAAVKGTAAPAGNYADRHDPFIYYPDILDDAARCAAHVVPYPQLASAISTNSVPAFSFITPDSCHDGHDAPCAGGQPGGLTSADQWLSQQLPSLLIALVVQQQPQLAQYLAAIGLVRVSAAHDATSASHKKPRSRATPVSMSRNCLRPRCNRDITVPIGVPMISAISLYAKPSTSAR